MSIHITYEKSVNLLRKLSNHHGFLASYTDKFNYRRIWSRDGIIQGLAGIMSRDEKLISTFEKNLRTLKKFQDETGRIPSNVDIIRKKISYGTLVGKIDATLWYVIGAGQYYKFTKNKKFLNEFIHSVDKAVCYLKALELNGKGLLFLPTGGDWADEYITHGYVLFDQALYLQALKEYAFLLKSLKKYNNLKKIIKKINCLKRLIEINYLPSESKSEKKEIFHKKLYCKAIKEFKEDYAMASFSSNGFLNYLDSFANSLLLLMNIPSKKEKEKITNYLLLRLSKQKIKLLPAFWPAITPKNGFFWESLKLNSLFEFRNKPYHYHNGGLWPLIQGFFIASLVEQGKKTLARKYLESFSEALEKDKYNFHEYYNGKNYKPDGIKEIGFSASGYMIAYLSVIEGKKVFR